MYRYLGAHGRVVYTNIEEQVPLAQRDRATLDLSHISLNTEVGAEIERRLAEQHAALSKSPYCRELVAASNQSVLERAWQQHQPALLCAGAVLLLLLLSPRMLRQMDASLWSKTLMRAIPVLASVGLVSFIATRTNETLGALRQRAAPCLHETFVRLKAEKDALQRHSQLIEQLRTEAGQFASSGGRALDVLAK